MTQQKLLLRGTTSYFETVDAEVNRRMSEGGLVFLNMPLPVGCNYKCPKCFSGGSDIYNEQLKQRSISPTFTWDLRKRMIIDASKLGAKTLVIAGAGEPLLYPGLDEIVKLTGNLKMYTVIFTNGFNLSPERAGKLFSNGASIVLSYDSITPENYNKVTGTTGNHKIAKVNLEAALALSEQYALTREGYDIVPFGVNTNPTKHTYNPEKGVNEIGDISNLISGRAVHFISHITPTGNAKQNWEHLTGRTDGSSSPQLKEAEARYGNGLGGSSRKQDGQCAYLYNGITAYEGHYMLCPNVGLTKDFGRFPEVSILDHLNRKKELMSANGKPLCATRR